MYVTCDLHDSYRLHLFFGVGIICSSNSFIKE